MNELLLEQLVDLADALARYQQSEEESQKAREERAKSPIHYEVQEVCNDEAEGDS